MGEAKRKQQTSPKTKQKFPLPKFRFTVLFCLIMIAGYVVIDCFRHPPERAPLASLDPQRSIGNPEAKLKIIEFIDFTCRECAQGNRILSEYLSRFRDQMYLSVRFFPLRDRYSRETALRAECAARQGKYWDFHHRLYDEQHRWKLMPEAEVYFETMGEKAGLDIVSWNACLQDQEAKASVEKDHLLGETHGVHSTPTYFVDGKMVVGTNALLEFLKKHFGYEPLELIQEEEDS